MTNSQEDKILRRIDVSIKKRVNHKIDVISDKLDNYIKADTEWKETANPAIQTMNNLTGGGKLYVGIIGAVGVIAGAIYAIEKLFIRS